MRQGGLIHAWSFAFEVKTQQISPHSSTRQQHPPKAQQHGDHRQLDTVCDETSSTRFVAVRSLFAFLDAGFVWKLAT